MEEEERGGYPGFALFSTFMTNSAETLATNTNFSRSPGLRRVKRNKEEVNNLVF